MLKEKTQYEFDKLHETVNEVFNVRMLTKSRERKTLMLEFVLHISLLIEGIVSRRWRGIWRRTMQP